MKIIDVHSHWGTRRGFPLQTPEELAQQHATWNSEPNYMTEAEMADYFRASNVAAILDFGFSKFRPLEEMRALHDYAFETEAAHRDVIIGHWIHIDPGMGEAGVRELRRCIDKRIGFLGFAVSSSLSPPSSDPAYDPYYKLCIEAGIPVADLRRHHRPRRRAAGRRRRDPGPLPPASSRLGGRALSQAQNRRGAARLALAGGNHRRAHAQAQHLVRAARLVAQVSHRPISSARSRAG